METNVDFFSACPPGRKPQQKQDGKISFGKSYHPAGTPMENFLHDQANSITPTKTSYGSSKFNQHPISDKDAMKY